MSRRGRALLDPHEWEAPLSDPLPFADAHADSLMWNRDLTKAGTEGHVDFPRLRAGGIGLQCFTLVTHGLPLIDGFSLFAARRGWPKAARQGPWSRATWQIDRLVDLCRRSEGSVRLALSADQLEEDAAAGRLSAVLGVEGASALEGEVERVAELYERGVRFMGLTHLTPNRLGGSSFPSLRKRGLSGLGRAVLDEMARVGMAVDLAHASLRTLRDILEHAPASGSLRVFTSHTGVQAVTPKWRNLPDDVLRAIADRGGVACIILAPVYLGGKALGQLVKHVRHAIDVMGIEAVGIGSDFDGFVGMPEGIRDAADFGRIAEALAESGLGQEDVRRVMGGNLRRFLMETMRAGER